MRAVNRHGLLFKTTMSLCVVLAGGLICMSSDAELQEVRVGGRLVLYGDMTRNLYAPGDGQRYGPSWLTGRPVGAGPGNRDGVVSWAGWTGNAPDEAQITLWTRLHVQADFSQEVAAFIEFDSQDSWGESFRSNYLTGADWRGGEENQVRLYQAYVDANNLYGAPLRLRVGRQELAFGNEWLVGPNTSGSAPVFGLSFDALRITWTQDKLALDVFAAKLAEGWAGWGREDIDFYGLYGACALSDAHTLDAYWFWLHDDTAVGESRISRQAAWMQRVMGVNQYDATHIHTVGTRVAGAFGAVDYDIEGAYQFGDAGQVGALFRPGYYGDHNAKYDAWAVNAELGYTFDIAWTPRVFLAYSYFGGEDRRDISFGRWLASWLHPYYTAPASVSFNRLFSNWCYSLLLDSSDLSNVHIPKAGIEIAPTDTIEVLFSLTWLRTVAAFHRPRMPWLSFWTAQNDKSLGWESYIEVTYHYTEDVYATVGWARLFTGRGLRQGHFNNSNGLEFNGGVGQKNADYLYFELGIAF